MKSEPFYLHAHSALIEGRWQQQQYLLIADGVIQHVSSTAEAGVTVLELPDGMLLPGFIDTQVNGGGGILFNQQPTVEALRLMMAAHRAFGTTAMLPTVITDHIHSMRQAADAVAAALARAEPGIIGIHFEGPHLSLAKRGCHPTQHLRSLSAAELELYQRTDLGVRMLTIAPEAVSPEQIRRLTDAGVIVCLGHSNANSDTVLAALDAGATGFTHLYNGMSGLTSREPGMVGTALADPRTFCGIILDGEHVHPLSARLAYQAKGAERLVLVTDAMSPVGTDQTEFEFFDGKVTRQGLKLTNAEGSLAGSVLDMASAVRYAKEQLQLDLATAIQMATATAADFISQSKVRGQIRPGAQADLIWMNNKYQIQQSWIAGSTA
jgi:N-acetylglucosamine-6-phosphate deacetylase